MLVAHVYLGPIFSDVTLFQDLSFYFVEYEIIPDRNDGQSYEHKTDVEDACRGNLTVSLGGIEEFIIFSTVIINCKNIHAIHTNKKGIHMFVFQ